ncbi:MAG: hypothetical protein ACOC1X_00335 [Promethearchaeota archaeon]
MLIGLTLSVLLFFSIFSLIAGAEYTQSFQEFESTGGGTVNGSEALTDFGLGTMEFGFNPITGAILILILAITVSVILGLNLFGFGLAESTVRTVTIAFVYGGLWASLSLLSYGAIESIPYFGGLLYLTLTFGYTIGVMEKISQ